MKRIMASAIAMWVLVGGQGLACEVEPPSDGDLFPGVEPGGSARISSGDAVVFYRWYPGLQVESFGDWNLFRVSDQATGSSVEYWPDEIGELIRYDNDSVYFHRLELPGGWIAGRQYEVQWIVEDTQSQQSVVDSILLDIVDTAPSAPAEIVIEDYKRSYSDGTGCGVSDLIKLTISPEPEGFDYYEIEVSRDDGFGAAFRFASIDTDVAIGAGGLDGGAAWPDIDPSEGYFARVRAVALSGDASPWVEPVYVEPAALPPA